MMDESFRNNTSSQESLPLSQETFNSLWNMMDLSGRAEMLAGVDAVNLGSSEAILVPLDQPQIQPHGAHVPSTRSSLPATCNWSGIYDFKLLFGHQEKVNKQIAWTYSLMDNKLYVKKDALCPFSFQTNTTMPGDVFLRAMVVYSSPEHASAVVTRCVNHSQQEIMQGIFEAEHLIRSDSQLAQYKVNSETKRHSVVVPYENPPVGQDYSTYIFKFACFGSCAGGPNRRALTLIFTLEQGQEVLGRISLDLKICSSPGRDRLNAEKNRMEQSTASGPAPKIKTDSNSTLILEDLCDNPPKKKKLKENKEHFIIKVKDVECYNFLTKMKKLFQIQKGYNRLTPEFKAVLQIYRSSSDEDDRS